LAFFAPAACWAFGLTGDDSPYVYLSDGGHFEDLGIYEMVRRRCRWILVSDADADPDRGFEDLGNAVRKIWIDLGVRITFENSDLVKATKDTSTIDVPYCALGTIEYLNDCDGDTRQDPSYQASPRGRARSGYHRLSSRPQGFSSSVDCRTMVRRVAARILPRARLLDDKTHCG
jgi:hypothetical protein